MTTSLSLSKELWEKGLKIETEKWWYLQQNSAEYRTGHWESLKKGDNDFTVTSYPAPSTDELFAVMPTLIVIWKMEEGYYRCCVHNIDQFYDDKFLPEALGKMCLYLLENNYIYKDERLVKNEK